ncbi:hypothetical protein J3Q64DRAFT_1640143 [Phycomyces blakesleeanus]|uniref:Uncharacterized protein n=2 Tax=Phycomyces blakesleeanus TaxID=4837 RepID=A0A162U8J6_PHYB8|nr:hypothetical protein PHYBLDRAFT_145646 [Phycomyces blakesleeanus NRRL 1555(-)]OAD73243.1 hypothetical protein PHYBLDRAFT_145646 [Phycomyces blakesleeanus NRRL 1555(-)]|eukprot:XP_018291283.1 hypothetical protein PHYBLDRAFT_145646 [Phycomyces blakesleeanus NRRL 1555(-)]
MGIKLSPAGRRLTTVIVAAPIMVATTWILYKRLVLGEERRVSDGRAIRPMGVRERDAKDQLN